MSILRADFGIIDVNNTSSGTSAATTSGVGDVLEVSIADNNSAAVVSDNKSNTWTQIGTDLAAGVVTGQKWYAVVASGKSGSGHTITVTFTGVGNSTPIWRRISGAAASPLDSSASAQGTDSTSPFTVTSGTLAQANNYVSADIFCDGAAGGYTAGGGFTKFQEQTNDALYWTQAAGDLTTSATTAVTPSWTVSGSIGGGAGLFVTVWKEAAGGSSAALTGSAATGSAGTTTSAISYALTGTAITGSTGTVSASTGATAALTGTAITSAAGTLVSAIGQALSGQAITSSQGSLTGITATAGFVKAPGPGIGPFSNGQFLAAPRGYLFTQQSSAALTGLSITSAQGTLSADLNDTLSGQSSTSAQGTITSALTDGISGQAGTGATGSVTSAISVALTGQSISGSQGTLTATSGTVLSLTGTAASFAQGSIASDLSNVLLGSSAQVSQGSVSTNSGITARDTHDGGRPRKREYPQTQVIRESDLKRNLTKGKKAGKPAVKPTSPEEDDPVFLALMAQEDEQISAMIDEAIRMLRTLQ